MTSLSVIILISAIIAIWALLLMMPKIKHREFFFITLSFLALWIFLSIREPYSDSVIYADYFDSIKVGDFDALLKNRWEILFKVLLYGIKLITNDSRVMFCIISFFTLIGPFLFIKRYSKHYLLSIVVFIAIGSFYMQFFILRQALAISIFLSFFYLIGEKKLFRYCIAIVFAALFHKTALILLLLYPIVAIPPSKYKTIAIAFLTVLTLIFSSQISSVLTSDFYDRYADAVFSGGGISLLLFYVALYTIYVFFQRRTNLNEKEEIVKGGLFTIFLQFFATRNNAFSRIAAYPRDSFCILLPNLTQGLKRREDRVFFSIMVIAVCICFIIVTGTFNMHSVA